MNTAKFNKRYRELLAQERALVANKGEEYSTNEDRFSNFHAAVALQVPGTTPEGAAWNMMSKHLEAAMHGLRQLDMGVPMSQDFWDEKLGDIIVYSRLIQIMTQERNGVV